MPATPTSAGPSELPGSHVLRRTGNRRRPRASAASSRESLNDPSTSTLNMSPFQHSKSFRSRSSMSSRKSASLIHHAHQNNNNNNNNKEKGGTGSTVKPGTTALYGDVNMDSHFEDSFAHTRPGARHQRSHLDDSDMPVLGNPGEEAIEDDVDVEEDDMVDRLRLSRNDAMQQHLYSTAAFWGNKAFELTADPNDAFWLAQILFLTHQFARAERILTLPRRKDAKGKQPAASQPGLGQSMAEEQEQAEQPKEEEEEEEEEEEDANGSGWFRLTELSIACRYLAAQCLIRQSKWALALDLLGPVNPFKPADPASQPVASTSFDGGIKFEASLCHLRGLIHLHFNSADKARECFLEALSIDVKCFESLETLVDGNMMTVDEEWNFIQALQYRAQLSEEDAGFVKMAYTVRLKKYKHHDEFAKCRDLLSRKYGLSSDPDVLFGLADELFAQQRWADCYAVTHAILSTHEGHGPTLPLHLACMHHIPALHSKLFLQAHDLVDKSPDSAVAWYAVGLWYYGQKRWDEARRFLGKAVLLDTRFGPAWIAFAHAYALEGEHDQAITAYSTAQRHFQGTHLPMLFIGMQHLQLANVTLGTEYLSTAWNMCQDDPLLANEMGVAKYGEEDWSGAAHYFNHAIELVNKIDGDVAAWTSTHINLGHALRKLGRYSEAQAKFEKAIDLDPRPATAFWGLSYVFIAAGQTEKAIAALHEALARSPGDPLGTELLNLALQDQTDSMLYATSKSGAVRFPHLANDVAESLDGEVDSMERDIMKVGDPFAAEAEGQQRGLGEQTMEEDEGVNADPSASIEMSMQTEDT